MSVDDLIRLLQELKNTGIETQLEAVGLTMGLEPMTAITDAILAAWTAFLTALLFARAKDASPVKLWAYAFLAAAVSSLAGVAYHGGRILFTPAVTALCWKVVPITTGVAALCLGSAAASVWLAPRARRIAFAILGLELVVCVVAATMSNSFKVAAYDYVPVLLALLVGCGLHWAQPAARLIAFGIIVSFAAFAIQVSTLRIGTFDHNDVFHLVQAAAMYLLYRGGAVLGEVQRPAWKTATHSSRRKRNEELTTIVPPWAITICRAMIRKRPSGAERRPDGPRSMNALVGYPAKTAFAETRGAPSGGGNWDSRKLDPAASKARGNPTRSPSARRTVSR